MANKSDPKNVGDQIANKRYSAKSVLILCEYNIVARKMYNVTKGE
jgi:hypothetical protein